jgi:hypothetical protein
MAYLGKYGHTEVVGSSSSSNTSNFKQNLSSLNWISLCCTFVEGPSLYFTSVESSSLDCSSKEGPSLDYSSQEGSSLGYISSSREGRLEETTEIEEALLRR